MPSHVAGADRGTCRTTTTAAARRGVGRGVMAARESCCSSDVPVFAIRIRGDGRHAVWYNMRLFLFSSFLFTIRLKELLICGLSGGKKTSSFFLDKKIIRVELREFLRGENDIANAFRKTR